MLNNKIYLHFSYENLFLINKMGKLIHVKLILVKMFPKVRESVVVVIRQKKVTSMEISLFFY